MTAEHLVHIPAPEGVAPGTGYTQVVTGSGRLVVVSGQVAFDADGKVVGEGDPAAQARQVFANLRACLTAAQATFADVVKLAFFVTDVAYLPAIRVPRDEFVDTERPPASTAVQGRQRSFCSRSSCPSPVLARTRFNNPEFLAFRGW